MNSLTENSINISEELSNRIKHRGFYEERLEAFEKFNTGIQKNLSHGLNIKTDIEFINYDTVFNEGTTEFKHTHQDLLDNRIKILNLHELIYSKDIDQNHKDKILNTLNIFSNKIVKKLNKLDYLHAALSNIKVIIFKDNFSMEETFRIDNNVRGNSYNHLILFIGKNVNVNISINTVHPENYESHNSIITDFTDIILDDYSKSNIVEFRNMNVRDIVYGRKTLNLGIGSNANWINIDKDSRLTLIEQHNTLLGENSKSVMSNIICGKDSEYTLYNISEHTGRGTESLMQNRCVLRSSRAIIQGLVRINENAFNSNGYQKSETILLDDKSRAISIPDLEIHNNEVKCTHGSTITTLDEDKIFYLQSRGISKEEASKILIEGFYDKILNDITDEKLREEIKIKIIA
jgi:Fe-S cluster assembly scaffold protein SufB